MDNNLGLKNFIIICSLGTLIFSLIFFTVLQIFLYLFIDKSPEYVANGVGAFTGSFFAFLFFVVQSIFGKYRQRRVMHFNALVRSQDILNRNLQTTSQIINWINGFIDHLNSRKFHIGKARLLVWDDSILSGLANLDLVNILHIHAHNIDSINQNLLTLSDAYEDLRQSYLNGRIDRSTYDVNASYILTQLGNFRNELNKFDGEIINRFSEVRVFNDKKNFMDKFFDKITAHSTPDDFLMKVQQEKEKLLMEIEKSKNPK